MHNIKLFAVSTQGHPTPVPVDSTSFRNDAWYEAFAQCVRTLGAGMKATEYLGVMSPYPGRNFSVEARGETPGGKEIVLKKWKTPEEAMACEACDINDLRLKLEDIIREEENS